MKKIIPMFIVSSVLLGGCSLPFTENQSSKIENYVSNNTVIMKTAEEIDKELQDYLNATSDKAKTFDKESIAERIQISKGVQTDLFKNISEQNVNQDTKEIKTIYMKLINEYLKTYNIYEKAIKTEDSTVLKAAVKENKIKIDGLNEVYLQKINEILQEKKLNELEKLTEYKKEGEEEKDEQ